jgi:hypothetical protein
MSKVHVKRELGKIVGFYAAEQDGTDEIDAEDPEFRNFIEKKPTASDVNEERDRRIHAGFSFTGKRYAFDPISRQRVTGAGTLAGFAISNGSQAGDLHWHGGEQPFRWIADDNSMTEMDAQTCFAFGQAAAAHEEAHIFAARAIKDMPEIASDFTSDQYWP